ncbi:odorant-binding protein 59a [Megalopta genalis]|uniref:odorant-binding protein 59a n=1 Tax=Megalopta genalis TaxID=115081 RepID=UPI003FD49920
MNHLVRLFLCCVILFFLNAGACLKCRTRSQEVDMQFQKVFKTCLKQHGGVGTGSDDSMSSDDETSDSGNLDSESSESDSSSEKIFYDKHIFYSNSDRSSYNQSMNNQRNRSYQNAKNNHNDNGGDSWNSRDPRNKKGDFNNGDSRYNNNTDHEKACVIQCFFNELNVVDQNGFPDRDSVIPLMNQDIRDPELKDFVEESIIECFRYLDTNKKDKCEFSQNLLKCLAEKGQQKCEDWDS